MAVGTKRPAFSVSRGNLGILVDGGRKVLTRLIAVIRPEICSTANRADIFWDIKVNMNTTGVRL